MKMVQGISTATLQSEKCSQLLNKLELKIILKLFNVKG